MAKRIQWNEADTAAQNARRRLPPLAKEYFAQGRQITRGKQSAAAFHRFRLRTRRFRSTLELFQACYGPGLAPRLEALRRVELLLEEVDDCSAVRRMFGRISEARLRRFIEQHARGKLTEFRTRWNTELDAEGQEQVWRDYLCRAR